MIRYLRGTNGNLVATGTLVAGVVALLLLSGCGQRFPDPSQEGEFERTVLIEEGTATWCTYCPEAAENLETLLEDNPAKFIVLALHSQDDYSNTETEDRLDVLGVAGFPTIIFDGVEQSGRKVSELQSTLDSRLVLGSHFILELNASLAADSVLYDITVIVSDSIGTPIDGILRIALVEDTVTHPSAGLLHHVVRRLPDADAPVTFDPGDTVDFHRSLALEASWGRPLVAVIWIEDETHKVYQAASFEVDGGSSELGDFSIGLESDSVQTLPVSQLGQSVNFDFALDNHTGNPLTVTLDVPEATQVLPDGWWFSLCDTMNCYPTPSDFEVPADGSLGGFHITLGTSIEEGDTEGSVTMTVTSGQEVDSQTFILRIE